MAKEGEPIAILGASLRLPRSDSLDALWEHLAAGRSLITEVPKVRWDATALRGDPRKENKTNSVWGGFVEDADAFDAAFFNISPREAAWMDPQQRFALELAWKAIEDAGYRASALAGSRTGVYMGVCHWDYAELIEKNLLHVDAYTPTGIAFSVIANRVSYFFDLHGPSITNDTACAASLVSIYEAVRALQADECELALAGGVNLCWSPNHFIAFSKSGMLSRDGRAKAFDQRADGYVRGEGGAMLLLKPLAAARRDRDPIHAVIREIGVNHGGHTSSLTVTNPRAQAALIADVYRKAGVRPESVSYIEAHGPGTPLGDPIEIAGLKEAFGTLYRELGELPEPGSCGIGSVKTNIGHLEGAAGVAGVVKVLAAMRHQTLPPNVDFQQLNTLIKLEGSPFRIQSEATPWPRRDDRPRRAGVSSFGFGGTNAHVLLEDDLGEAPSLEEAGEEPTAPWVLPLSAKDEIRLRAYAEELRCFLEAGSERGALRDLVHTFQVGREPFEERAVFVAADRDGLVAALVAYVAGSPDDRVRTRGARRAAVNEQEQLADRWLDGHPVDWQALRPGAQPRRIHAPLYPFARERHWMDETLGGKDKEGMIHPLLHRNISRLDGPRYSSSFGGNELFWADHRVGERQVLPGVAYLEMARAAYAQATAGEPAHALRFENVVWTRPILACAAPVRVELRLRSLEGGAIRFEIESPDPSGPRSANAQGTLVRTSAADEPPALDLAALRERCSSTLEAAACYARLRESGVHHGPGFQALTRVYRGEGSVLASLALPRPLVATLGAFALHPILLDAAIQAWIGLVGEEDEARRGPAVPFACRAALLFGPCEASMWAHVRWSGGAGSRGGLRRLDIDLCDKQGRVCVRFLDLALRIRPAATIAAGLDDGVDPIVYTTWSWSEHAAVAAATASAALPPRKTKVLLAGFAEGVAAELGRRVAMDVMPLSLDERRGAAVVARDWFGAAHAEIAALLRGKGRDRHQRLILVPESVPATLTAPLAALLKTAAMEQPRFDGALVTIAGALDVERLATLVRAEHARGDAFSELRYRPDGAREVRRPIALDPLLEHPAPSIQPGAAYWITGGLGGLGLLFAAFLVERGATRIVLSGRGAPSERALRSLERLRDQGAVVHVDACDMTHPTQVSALVTWIEANVGPLKGVIHAAGALRDASIAAKDPATIDAVFGPKVAGAIHLDEATRGVDLDFLVFFSSVAAVFGNAGQADYAGANAFLDAFAEHRAAQVQRGERRGVTRSIAWPLWAEGGMTVDATSLAALRRRFGAEPLPTRAGLRAFERILAAGSPCVGVHHGERARIEEILAGFGEGSRAPAPAPSRGVGSDDLEARTIAFLKAALGDSIQMDTSRIQANRKLEEYGLDSIVIVELTNRLEESLGSLPKTLFFEYVDLEGVAGYLMAEHREALLAAFADGVADAATSAPEPAAMVRSPAPPAAVEVPAPPAMAEAPAPPVSVEAPAPPARVEARAEGAARARAEDGRHDIAIIGLSVRYPKAEDQEAFWELLSRGQHAFEKIPSSRWNHEVLRHPERDVLGKTVVQTGAFLDGVDRFDPRYFRISQYEAELMSPEVRLFLQASVEAFEDAGYSREQLQARYGGDVAVLVGSMTNEYDLYGFQNMLMRGSLASGSYMGTIPNMVSYFYGFTGPSYFLTTMCSASSTCVHEAVHMLRSGRCKVALAGGVSLLLHPQKLIATSQEHFTTKTAEVIRGYGLGADGTILGEGVGALVLKTLADAERDGDPIYAVIKGTGISNAGVRNGFTVPNPNQQAAAIVQALEDAGIDPRTIGYLEGHGSGTALGDPIEIRAATQAFRRYTMDLQFCPIGTVKSNIAHLLAASGLAGITKVLLQLKHAQLAPSLHAETLNPNIPFAETPFYVQRELAPWPRRRDADGQELPRRAGVTSIGAGGMNSHIVLEEHRPLPPAPARGGPALFVFSAMTRATLLAWLARFAAHLVKHPKIPLEDLAYTLQVGKNELPCRLSLIAETREALLGALSAFGEAPGAAPGLFYTESTLEHDERPDRAQIAEDTRLGHLPALAAHWVKGFSIDWDMLHAGRRPRRVSLPAYPFERVRCWYPEQPDAPSVLKPMGARLKLHPFVGANRSDRRGLRYTTSLHLPELLDYVYTQDREPRLLPTLVADLVPALARVAGLEGPLSVCDLRVYGALGADTRELRCALDPRAEGGTRVLVEALDATGSWRPFVEAAVLEQPSPVTSGAPPGEPAAPRAPLTSGAPRVALDALRAGAARVLEQQAFYAGLGAEGRSFRPYLEVVERAYLHADGTILCQVRSSPPQQDHFKKNVEIPPWLLGAAFQALILGRSAVTLARIGVLAIARGDASQVLVRPRAGEEARDVWLVDDAGAVVATLEGVLLLAGDAQRTAGAYAAAAPASGPPLPHAPAAPQADPRRDRIHHTLRAEVARILKFAVEDVGARTPFYDLGFDSIALTRLTQAINEELGSSLTPAVFFECEHIEALGDYLIRRHGVTSPVAVRASEPAVRASGPAGEPLPAAPHRDGVAIVGMAARFPGSENLAAFWEHLAGGHDLITRFPFDRYEPAYRARIEAAGFPKRGGFLSDVDRFDAAFFKTSPAEAERMDPQQRLILETVWRALEDSGYEPGELPKDTGVFIAVTGHDYASLLQAHGVPDDGFIATGNSHAMLANRISFHLDVHGPSQPVDTACSSSLVALLHAAHAIRSGRCHAAIAGAVNLNLSVDTFEGPHLAGMLSPEGRCKTFSKSADGYVRGEGVAALLLKPLTDAERDGDRILGVIVGGAENHGGRASSLTAPSTRAQADLLERALVGLDPASIEYIETHGTGTSLGDPVEINALRLAYAAVLDDRRDRRDRPAGSPFIGLGSVKSNIGHLEAAAGMAGVIKVLLAMRHGQLPATLHCEDINPYIELDQSPFYLVRERREWPRRSDARGRPQPRRAGVSSFGFGGSNAHVVLEEYLRETPTPRRAPRPAQRFADTRFWIPGASPARSRLLWAPRWIESPPGAPQELDFEERLVFLCEAEAPVGLRPEAQIVAMSTPAGDIAARYTTLAIALLETLQGLLRGAGWGRLLVQVVVPLDDERRMFEGLGALLDTASAEDPRVIGQVVGVGSTVDARALGRLLDEEARGQLDRRVRHQDGRRAVRQWSEVPDGGDAPAFRPGGVYLITGGLGALGRLVALDMARRAPGAALVLAGASPLSAERAAALAEIQAAAGCARYHRVDVANSEAVTSLVRAIVTEHGGLHGVIHCAGIHRDSYLIHKTREELLAVFEPKVAGAVNLERACRGLDLERFVLFSSLGGAFGNPGQADYAAANGFLDAFADHHGHPVTAIDWPLWRDGGMRVDAETERALFEQMGQRPLATGEGLSALPTALSSGARQVAVVAGEGGAIRRFFARAHRPATPLPEPAPRAARGEDGAALLESTVERLRILFARVTGLPAGGIEARVPLENYGIDSLMIVRLNRALGEIFGALSKTLFFEHRTLGSVASHLVDRHRAACLRWTGHEGAAAAPASALSSPAAAPAAPLAQTTREPIAIIGISGRYPSAPDLAAFWANLAAGKDAVGEIPEGRWALEGFYHQDPAEAVERGMSYSKWGGFLDGFADFDPLFFKISPRDAAAMDPQERLFLMSAWEACEDAGYPRARLAARHGSRVGVFVGITKTGFDRHGPYASERGGLIRPRTSFSSVANRVSYHLDLNGPSMPIDTMCSSSLIAIHEACEHLRSGDCELALAGGVNLYLHPESYLELCATRMLSADGRCKSFGEGSDGFVPGEGVGCVLLKPLSRALADGDQIHALIRSTAINHGGKTNGYTVPNPAAQREVVRLALERAGLDARAVSYVEAHGTGTQLGDPIEVSALTQAFRADTEERGFCALGSAKSNIGHLEAAAGIAGLTKVILQMKHGKLAPSLHAGALNPHIDFEETPFVVQRELTDWYPSRASRIAGVSSFGAAGANAHLLVEEYRTPDVASAALAAPVPVPLSARDPERLRAYAARLLAFVESRARLEPGSGIGVRRPLQPGEPHPAPTNLARLVRARLSALLGVEPVELDAGETFEGYGLDRVQRTSLREALEIDLQVDLSAVHFGRLSSIDEVVTELQARLPARTPRALPAEAGETVALEDLAYTLQVGREAMDARLAIEARTLDELASGLRAFLDGREDWPGLHRGSAHDHREIIASLTVDEELGELTRRWMKRGKLARLLSLWVKGLDVDWTQLPRARRPRITSLPTYPFARETYGVPSARSVARGVQVTAPGAGMASVTGAIEAACDPAVGRALLAEVEELERRLRPVLRAQLGAIPEAAIQPHHLRWRRAIDALLLGAEGPASSPDEAWSAWDAYKQAEASSGLLAQIALAEATLRALPEILTGARPATEVMFPRGSMHLVEAVYKNNPVATRFNAGLAAAAHAFVRQRLAADPGARLRILEVGAGTGGTTEAVLRELAPSGGAIAEYRYTDVSRSFLIHAERHYRSIAPQLTTALFDVERPVAGQDVEPGAYDLVIAANVLHATRDIRQTLSSVRALLRPGGLLLLNETSRSTLFTQVTFGLLDGWWRFEDGELRLPGCPALSPDAWRRVLDGEGLSPIAGTAGQDLALGQQLIAAVAAEPARPVGREPVRDLLLRLLGETLNVAPATIGVHESFADYGLDSILGIELVHKLNRALNIDISVTRLFDFTTVAQLESFLVDHYGATLESREADAAARGSSVAPVPAPAPVPVTGSHPTLALAPMARRAREPIAIVGVSGRFARSANVDELWDHLIAGRDLVEPVSRFDLDALYRDAPPGSYCRHGSFIEGVDRFDPLFFNISGLEATYMDPQQRLFLEEAWKTLEDAGHAGADMEGRRCGVFVGCSSGDYHELFRTQPPGQAFWGNTCSLIPARIAYYLDLKGPAVAVDTACSSSLLAVHLACQSIWAGESEMALAGGVFVQSTPRFFLYANQAKMLSPTGRCAAFGARADGIVPGEAVAAVLLRPLSEALADGDTLRGMIVATGTNQDGTTNGITAPSAASQERLIRRVYEEFGIDPSRIGMVEAHGTGTVLGDPIEHAALTRAFAASTSRRAYCALGSIKSNLGHATTAAGVIGLIKVLGALKHGVIPPSIHCEQPNPEIRLDESPFFVNAEPRDFPSPRLAALSSFGFSGTNAHLVVAEALPRPRVIRDEPAQLMVLSARSAAQLRKQVERLLAHLEARPDLDGGDLSFTLLVGRKHLHHRLAIVTRGVAELATQLRSWLDGRAGSGVETSEQNEKDHRVDPALGAAGNQLLQRLHDRASLSAEEQRARLGEVARLFLDGYRLDFDALFDRGERRRLSLPTYPFAANRYWIDPPVPKTERVEAAAPAPAPGKVLLADLAALAEPIRSPTRLSAPVHLAPLAVRPAPAPWSVRRLPDEDGVRRLEIAGAFCDALALALAGELAAVASDEAARAVVISGGAETFDTGSCSRIERSPLTCPVPVVAALRGSASGAGLAFAKQCDFIVLAEEGRYTSSSAGAPPFEPRSGRPRVPSARVEVEAVELAKRVAEAPRLALVELKRHMRHDAQAPRPPAGAGWEAALSFDPIAAATSDALLPDVPQGTGRRIALDSDTIEIEAFDDGVVVVRMCERRHKNTFTEAFMRGMLEAFAWIRRAPQSKVVVLTGHDGYFACGGTREGLEKLQQGATRFTDLKIYSLPLECELPVIAAMQGHAIGAGWSLGMFCDLAIFSAESIYHSNYLFYGFTPGAGATLIFPHRLGDDLGREVLFTAREYRGRELAERGVGVAAAPAAEVLRRALAMAHRMARASRGALTSTKAALVRDLAGHLDGYFARELAMHEKTFVGNERVRERIQQAFPEPGPGAQPARPAEPRMSPGPQAAPAPPAAPAPARLASQRAEVRSRMVATLAEDLMIDPIEIRDDARFLDLGLDSILAVTWIRRINLILGVELPATAVYAHPTVGDLVDAVAGKRALEPEDEPRAPVTPPPAPPPPAPPPARPPLDASMSLRSPGARSDRDRPAIAIIGASGAFPMAADLDAFWENIRSGRDCVAEVPLTRWDLVRHYDPDPQAPDKSYCKWMGSLDGVELFDPLFFNITPREAELMDPQQRIFLQHAWHCIEDAAIDPSRLSGSQCGVFVGCGPSGYADLIRERNAYSLIGRASSILGARIAYLLDLHGPSLSIDTACSSSLVALVEACNSLALGDSDLAMAGGVSVLLGPWMHVDTSKASMLSPEGRCFSFDQRANGFVPGEGVGVLLLKRLDDAERDGDPIRAVIRGWGMNQDGKTNGITAPNPLAQSRLLRGIHERFGIDPASVELIEAHGTGTALGDPIEIEGLIGAFRGLTGRVGSIAVGSVKSNVGHLLAAAGVAGALKAMLALEHRALPPTLHVERVNEHIAIEGSPFFINTRLRDWPAPPNGPRRVGVSSFGFSGTNAHLVLEAHEPPPPPPAPPPAAGPRFFTLSARSAERLRDYAATMAGFITSRPDLDLADMAHTLQVARTPFAHRLELVFDGRDDLLGTLASFASGQRMPDPRPRPAAAGPGRRLRLPGYPFARERHWIEAPSVQVDQPRALAATKLHPLLDRNASTLDRCRFTGSFTGDEPFLTHRVAGPDRLLLGLFHPEMARAAATLATRKEIRGLKDLIWGKPTRINGKSRELSVVLYEDEESLFYQISADGEDAAPCHLGEMILSSSEGFWPEPFDPDRLRASPAREDVTSAYARFAEQASAVLGPDPAVLRALVIDGAELLARLHLRPAREEVGGMRIDPRHLDAIWRLLAFRDRDDQGGPRFPRALSSLVQGGPLPDELLVSVRSRRTGPDGARQDTITVYDEGGQPWLALDGLVTAPVSRMVELRLGQEERG